MTFADLKVSDLMSHPEYVSIIESNIPGAKNGTLSKVANHIPSILRKTVYNLSCSALLNDVVKANIISRESAERIETQINNLL